MDIQISTTDASLLTAAQTTSTKNKTQTTAKTKTKPTMTTTTVTNSKEIIATPKQNKMLVELSTDGTPKLHCPVCNKALVSLTGYVTHLKKHEPPGGFCCRYCDARYCSNHELKRHHNENHISIACRLCQNITFNNEADYREHIKAVHNGIDRQMYVCDKCGAQYKTYDPYRRHVSTNCGNIKPHKCDKCDMCFVTKYNLKQHMESHTGERKFCCSYCGKNFLQKGRLVEHERSHTGEKPYKCDVCGKCFAHRESIVTHSSIHTGIRLVECKCCLARFSCYSNLLKHRRTRLDSCGLPEFDPPKNRTRTHRSRIPPTLNPTSEIKVCNLNKVLKEEEKNKTQKRKRRSKLNDTPTKTATSTITSTATKINTNIRRGRKKQQPINIAELTLMKQQQIESDVDYDDDNDDDEDDRTSDYKVDFEEFIDNDNNYSDDAVDAIDAIDTVTVDYDVDDGCIVQNMASPTSIEIHELQQQQQQEQETGEVDDNDVEEEEEKEHEFHDTQVNNFVNAEINIKIEDDINLFNERDKLLDCLLNDNSSNDDDIPAQIEIFNVDTECAVTNLTSNISEKDVLEETEIEILVQNKNEAEEDTIESKEIEEDIFQQQFILKNEIDVHLNRKPKKFKNGKTINKFNNKNVNLESIIKKNNTNIKIEANKLTTTTTAIETDEDLPLMRKIEKNKTTAAAAVKKNKKLPTLRIKIENAEKTPTTKTNDIELSLIQKPVKTKKDIAIKKKDNETKPKRLAKMSQQELRARLSLLRKRDKTFSCPHCIKIYHMRRPYEKHLQDDHHLPEDEIREMFDNEDLKDIEKEIFKCKICQKIYLVEKRLMAHELLHGPDGKLRYKCPCYCSIYFGSKEEAKIHAQKEHRDLIYCKICKKFMNGHDSLKTHMKNHHQQKTNITKTKATTEVNNDDNSDNKIYTPRIAQRNLVCEKCGKKFAGRTSLTDHVRSDCGRVPLYACTVCGKHLTTAGILKTHMLLHKDDTPFQCEECGKTFKVKAQYKTHIRTRHTGNKPFKCHLCPKEYPYRESLLTHMTVHTGIKRFLCNGCGKRFTCISNLQAHRRVNVDSCGLLPLNAKATQYMGVQKGNLLIGAKPEAGVDYKETNTLIAKEVIDGDLPQEFLSCEEPDPILDRALLLTTTDGSLQMATEFE